MKKKLISLLLVFSFLLNIVPLAFAVEDGAEQAENTEVSLVDPNGEEEAGNMGDEDVAAPEDTGEEADVSEDVNEAEPGTEGNDGENQMNILAALAAQPAVQSASTLGSAAAAAGLTPVQQTHHAIANGVTYDKIALRNKNKQQVIGYMTEIDLSKNVTLKATYSGYYTAGSTAADRVTNAQTIAKGQWSMSETTKLAANYSKIADPAGTVVMATNGDYFNLGTGEPTGYLIMEGNVVKTSYEPYFAILTDGTAVIRDAGTPTDDVMEAVSGPLYLLKNGVIQVSPDGSTNPRNSVGIREDGSVVFFMAEGRLAPRSIGMDCYEVAAVLKDAGCVTALYLDGGGSATFAAREEGDELKMLSKPSDGQERSISSGFLCISTESQDGVFDHAVISPREELYTPGSAVQFSAVGVDRSGGAADLPDGLVWQLAEDSTELGMIDAATGLFTANADSIGVVTVALCQGDTVVGTASVELVKPDEVTFNSTEISMDFDEESDLGLVVHYQNRDVNYKDGDIKWTMEEPNMGSFTGNIFRSTEMGSVTAHITAASAFDETVNGTIKVVIGMLPVVVWDFEDKTDESGSVTQTAEDYYCGEEGILTHHNYGRGGKESIEIVRSADGEPVRFGQKSLKLNYDFTDCGDVTEGACIGTLTDFPVDGKPTGIGVWVYAPEGVGITYEGKDAEGKDTQAGFWLRGYVKTATNNALPYDFTLEPKAVVDGNGNWDGTQPGIYWTGWKYLEADLTSLPAPYTINQGDTLRLMFVNGTKMGTRTAGSIYFDNFQFVYGTNIDDVTDPQVTSITVNNQELVDGSTISGSTFDLRAYFSDADGKYDTGVDADTVRLYVDGVDVTKRAGIAASDGYIDYKMQLVNGTHSVTVSLCDKAGNEASETRYFTVADSSTESPIRVTHVESMAAVGGYVTLEIRGTSSSVSECDTVIRLGAQYSDCTVTFSPNFKAADDYDPAACYSAKDRTVTVKAVRVGGRPIKDGNLIATVRVQVPASLTSSSTFLYEVKSGMCYNMDGDLMTFSAPAVALPVGAAISVSCDPVLTGRDAVLTVTDLEGKPVANAAIFKEDNTQLGTTGEDGTLTSNAFSTAGVVTVYAQDSDGRLSMRYKVYTYEPVTVTETAFLFNATENGGATKNITWLSNPTVTEKQFLRWRVQGTENWTATIPATTELRTFVTGSYQAVNVNSVTLGGLVAGTTYEYQVAAGDNWPEVAESFTAGTVGASQKFFVLGDIQAENTDNISNIFEKLRADGYDFGIQTGDAVDAPTNFAELNGVVGLLNAEQLGSADVIHVLGNHEFAGDGNADIAGSVFALPAHSPGSYWSTTYGNVYVAVVNYSGSAGDMKTAMEWMVQDAQASNATWKILTVHQPAYYTNASGGNAPMTAYIPTAAEAAGIDVVFSGHDHSFARTNPLKGGEIDAENGVYYYICGSSGEKSYPVSSQNIFDYSKVFAQATTDFNAVYLSVEATQSKMTINVYNVLTDGSEQLLDSLTLMSLTGSCAEKGHVLDNAVCSNGELICNNCHAVVDPVKWNYTGWARDEATGRKMYFLRGVAQTGWFLVEEDNYCFDENGVAYDGEQVVDEVPLVFDNGLVVSGHTGFIKKTNGKTYYYDNGEMALGLTEIGDDTYYFEPDGNSANYGAMVTGWRYIRGLGYGQCYFYEDGHMHRFVEGDINAENSMITVVLRPFGEDRYTDGKVAVWSQVNGQDDIRWIKGEEQDDGTWVVKVPMCLYKDVGKYSIHGYDGKDLINIVFVDVGKTVTHKFTNYTISTDNCVGAETKIAQCDYGCGTVDKTGWTEKNHVVTAVQDNNVLTVKMADVASHGHTKVRFAVWSTENGQDDLAWYNAEKQADGNWTFDVDLTEHRSTGNYQVHAYANTGDSDTMRMAGYTLVQVVAFDDVKPPKVVAAVTADYSSIRITVRNAESYDRVLLPVWSEDDGQDDLVWYKAEKQVGGSWTYSVNLADHNSTGRYLIHAYGTKAGKTELIATTTVTVARLPDAKTPTAEAVVSADYSTMQITVKNAETYTQVMIPVWSEVNGQDDLVWYTAKKGSDGNWTYTVDLAAHNSTGRYQIHVYGTKDGERALIAKTTANVAKLPATKTPTVEAVVSADYSTMQITVKNAGEYEKVMLPVWSEVNDQDDLKWYNASKQTDGSWTYTVNLATHNSTGRYQIHVYGTKAEKQALIAKTTANVVKLPATKTPTVEAVVSEKLGTMQITVKNAGAYDKIMLPVWSEVNGQDDLKWYNASKQTDGSWTYTVNLATHNSTGRYQIHVYGTKAEKQALIAKTTANVVKLPATKTPTVEAVVSEKLGTMQITVKNAGAYDKVMLPVWSEVNGQDDLVWYSAKKGSDGNWTYTVNLKQHNSVGAYQIHVYGTKDGTQSLIANTRVVVASSAKQVG